MINQNLNRSTDASNPIFTDDPYLPDPAGNLVNAPIGFLIWKFSLKDNCSNIFQDHLIRDSDFWQGGLDKNVYMYRCVYRIEILFSIRNIQIDLFK